MLFKTTLHVHVHVIVPCTLRDQKHISVLARDQRSYVFICSHEPLAAALRIYFEDIFNLKVS